MSRMVRLIDDLKRARTEPVALGELVTQYVEPFRVQPDETYVSLGVKWYGQGVFARAPKLGSEIKATTLYRVSPGQFIYNRMFVTEGSFGLVPDDLAHGVVSNEFPAFDVDRRRVNPEWLLLKFQDPTTVKAAASEAEGSTKSRRRWKESQFQAFVVDLPPLPVQDEIVRLLRTFRTLQDSLEAELTARRCQYAHYRDRLLSFSRQSVSWAPMSEAGEFFRGRRFTKNDVVDEGIPSIHYGEIYTRYGTSTSRALSMVRSDLRPKLRFAKPGDVVIAGVGETVEDVGKAVAWLGSEDVAIHDDCFAFRHDMDPKYVSYFFQTDLFHDELAKYVSRAKMKRISGVSLSKLKIPVPSREQQKSIVALLDKFDALVNDLSIGLPAEIVARRMQYEYYRDKLLSIEERTG